MFFQKKNIYEDVLTTEHDVPCPHEYNIILRIFTLSPLSCPPPPMWASMSMT